MLKHVCRSTVVVALLAAGGCSSQSAIRNVADSLVAQPDPTVELLESELRWMEDNLYRMDSQLETSLRQIESMKRNNAALRLELANRDKLLDVREPTLATPNGGVPRTQGTDQKFDEESADEDEDLLNFEAPKIEFGKSSAEAVESRSNATDGGQPFELPAGKITIPKKESIVTPPPASEAPKIQQMDNPFLDDEASPEAEDGQVMRILLNQRLTGGYDRDRKMGHDGIMVVIEPQDAYARYTPTPGPVTIELREPGKPGIAGQVGKWSFTDAEVQPLIKKTLMGQGIHIELPWPAGSPTTEKLELTVAYETTRGKKLTARRDILITPTTSALVTQAEDAEQKSWYLGRTPTASRWKPTR